MSGYRIPQLPLSQAPHQIGSGILLFREEGTDVWNNLGNARSCEFEPTSEETEEKDRGSGLRLTQAKYYSDFGGTLSMTLVQVTDFARRVGLNASEAEDYTQPAAAALTINYASPGASLVYECRDVNRRYRYVTAVTVEDGAGADYVLNQHYKLDVETGLITIIAKPVGADNVLCIKFSAPAVAANGKKIFRLHSAGGQGIRGAIRIVNANTVGKDMEYNFPLVSFKATGSTSFIAEDSEIQTFECEGTLLSDPFAETGYEFGYAIEI